MGITACNVSGMTFHAALGIGKHTLSRTMLSASHDLIAAWEGVDFLFVDEVSMISCHFLCMISKRLSLAKGDPGSFGGINMIFAGDFAQLSPVAETRLYTKINTHNVAGTVQGQRILFGKILWLSVSIIVILMRNHHQSGPENAAFVSLLGHLWKGRCINADHRLLSSRIINSDNYDADIGNWSGVSESC